MKISALLIGLILIVTQAAAQSVGIEVGKILAVDREAKMLLLTDRSIWSLSEVRNDMPNRLAAGDRVEFSYRKADKGPPAIVELEITHHATESGGTEIAEGTVLAFDRRAQLLILTDKSVWPLAGLDPRPPPGLGAGDRVRIEYHTGKDGSIAVADLIVTFK